jgi:hypothetical protein
LDFLTDNNFGLFILIIAPGFLSLKMWRLIHPSRHITFADSLYEAIFYGIINYFVIALWLIPLMKQLGMIFKIFAYIFSFVATPLMLPKLLKWILSLPSIQKNIINPIPKAWDIFFSKRKPCFMLIHLKNAQVIGGLYAYSSAASSYPEKEDLYLQEIWQLDEEGKFLKPIDGTMGLLVNYDTVDYIELFNCSEQGG